MTIALIAIACLAVGYSLGRRRSLVRVANACESAYRMGWQAAVWTHAASVSEHVQEQFRAAAERRQ